MICAGPLWEEQKRAESWAQIPGTGVPNVRGNRQTTDAKPNITDGDGCPPGTSKHAGEPAEDI